ncbi:chorismate mutase [Frankineae bacterium MT45]|nr:chorismate mutase [Frankineae bacterium MT45]
MVVGTEVGAASAAPLGGSASGGGRQLDEGAARSVRVRAIRGANQIDSDDRDAILAGTAALVTEVMERNELSADDIISVIFTATPDLTAEFPAYAARQLGLTDVPLLCATEISVPAAMPRVLRLLAHVETPRSRAEIRHVYLGGAAALRTDLPQ